MTSTRTTSKSIIGKEQSKILTQIKELCPDLKELCPDLPDDSKCNHRVNWTVDEKECLFKGEFTSPNPITANQVIRFLSQKLRLEEDKITCTVETPLKGFYKINISIHQHALAQNYESREAELKRNRPSLFQRCFSCFFSCCHQPEQQQPKAKVQTGKPRASIEFYYSRLA